MKSLYRILKYKLGEQWRELSLGLKRTLTATVLVFLHVVAVQTSLGDASEAFARQLWYRLRGPRPAPSTVTYVRLDSETLRTINLPSDGMIPRWAFAEAIKKITAAGAKLIVLDFFFFAKGLDEASDHRLAAALSESPSVIGRSVVYRFDSDPSGVRKARREDKRPRVEFAKAAKSVVLLQVQADFGRLVERIVVPEEILDPEDLPTPLLSPIRKFVAPDAGLPGKFDLINYYGEPSLITNLSLAELLRPDRTPSDDYFRDRVVFIGPATHAAPGVPGKDAFRVPSSSTEMYGVEIHATVVGNLLDGTWLRRYSPQAEQIALNITIMVSVLMVLNFAPAPGLALSVGLFAAWSALSFTAFSQALFIVPGALWFGALLPLFSMTRWAFDRRRSVGL